MIAGILFFVLSKGNTLFILYGILTLTLCGGDAFHLVPRAIRAFKGTSEKIERQMGRGLQISSIYLGNNIPNESTNGNYNFSMGICNY